jgi:hypothetical protein
MCAVLSQTRGGGNDTPAPEQDLVVDVSSRRVVFVDDEPANCRLGLRMLSKLGIPRENITVLVNGAWWRAASTRSTYFRMLEDARNGIHRLLSPLAMLWLAPKYLVNLHGCATVVGLACVVSGNRHRGVRVHSARWGSGRDAAGHSYAPAIGRGGGGGLCGQSSPVPHRGHDGSRGHRGEGPVQVGKPEASVCAIHMV